MALQAKVRAEGLSFILCYFDFIICMFIILFVSLINCSSSSLFHCSFVVCRDGSCGSTNACLAASIDCVVGPSCKNQQSCVGATIGSVDSSCNGNGINGCFGAELSGVDLINSCNAFRACLATSGDGAFDELIDCCNEDDQCFIKDGLDIVNAGCVSYMCI